MVPLTGVLFTQWPDGQLLVFSVAEVKMAKVPDLFEDLKNCYR